MTMTDKETLQQAISSIQAQYPGEELLWDWVPLSRPLSMNYYKQWIADGYHGTMDYLKNHTSKKENPQELMATAQSAIVFTQAYYPELPGKEDFPLKSSRIATYAQGQDYHHWFREKLQQICDQLRQTYPQEDFMAFSDSSPILERDLAQRAGLGWIGKNTCLIDKNRGSLFFIGEIYTSVKPPQKTKIQISPDHCGKCQRCIEICPTDALISPQKMDANRCIAYLTIESKTIPSEEMRHKMGDWLFGCDLCQTVCPWNEKVFGKNEMAQLTQETQSSQREDLVKELSFILESSNKKLMQTFKKTPLARAAGNKLKRNAMIVATNLRLKELTTQIKSYTEHPFLGELAQWSLKNMT